jgi:hypothetical protein
MAILVRFKPTGMTAAQYESVSKKLEGQGHWPPEGLLAHVSFGGENDLYVSEVWETRGQQEQFAQNLVPVLEEEGIKFEGEPEFLDVHAYEFREARSETQS